MGKLLISILLYINIVFGVNVNFSCKVIVKLVALFNELCYTLDRGVL